MKKVQLSSDAVLGLSETHLCDVQGEHRLIASAKDAFLQMQESARTHGVDIQICSSYRSFDRQLLIWNKKWQGQLPIYNIDGTLLKHNELNDIEKIHAIMLWSALPGASRHHWGSDCDVYDKNEVLKRGHKLELTPNEYEHDGPCARLSNWLLKNAKKFDYYLPYFHYCGGVSREPWHISYYPSAIEIEKSINIDALYSLLAKSDILGKSGILKNLPTLVTRYTLNNGLQDSTN